MDTQDRAQLLLHSVEKALYAGVKHYNIHGALLRSAAEILAALKKDGEIMLEPPDAPSCAACEKEDATFDR